LPMKSCDTPLHGGFHVLTPTQGFDEKPGVGLIVETLEAGMHAQKFLGLRSSPEVLLFLTPCGTMGLFGHVVVGAVETTFW
jgi:hypothetical protein